MIFGLNKSIMELIITTREELEELVKASTADSIKEYYLQKESKNPNSKHITVKEAAKRLRVSVPTIRNYVNRGLFKANKVGNRILIDTSSLDKVLSEVKSLRYKR